MIAHRYRYRHALRRFGGSFALVAVIVTATLLTPVSLPTGDDVAVPDHVLHRPVGPLTSDAPVSQQFPATGTRIAQVRVQLGTYGRKNPGTLQVVLEQQEAMGWGEVGTAQLTTADLVDNAFTPVPFPSPLVVTAGRPLRLTMRGDAATTAGAVTWWVNPRHTPEQYILRVNGTPQPGTARFEVRYLRERGRLIAHAGTFFGRITPLLGGAERRVLLVAMVALVVLAVWLTGRRVPE